MAKIAGTVRRSDLEGGQWLLETPQGSYQLVGSLEALRDGMRAEVSGSIERAMMGIGMTGPQFRVSKVKPLS
jgi:hypothetical protein